MVDFSLGAKPICHTICATSALVADAGSRIMEKEIKEKDENKQGVAQRLFSTQGLLIAIFLLMGYWIFFGGDEKAEQPQSSIPAKTETQADASSQNTIVGISDSLNQEAIDRLGVDLTEHLDPKLVPPLIEQAMKETAQAGVQAQEFVQAAMSNISNKIRDISSIDLNNDGFADPVLVVPQNVTDGAEHMVLSIRVPDPAAVSNLPAGSDQEAWVDIANNKSIEVMTASAIKQDDQSMTIQSAPNPQVYSGAHPPYYHHYSPLSTMLMTSLMMGWMMSPSFYGPGLGYGHYGAPSRTTSSVSQNRAATASNLTSARGSNAAALNSKGQAVATNNFKQVPPKSLNQIKSTQFRSREGASAARTGGFGRDSAAGTSQSAVRPSQRSSNSQTIRPSQRKSFSSSFGRSGSSRKGFGRSGGRRR